MESSAPRTIARNLVDSVFAWYRPESMRWHYEDGLFLFAAYSVAIAEHDSNLFNRICKTYEAKIDSAGLIASYRLEEYNLDQINAGRLLFDLYDITGDSRYAIAIETLVAQLETQPRTLGGGFWHKKIYPWQIWLDGLYMAQPFRTLYGKRGQNFVMLEDVVRQMITIEQRTRDEKTGLLFHAWDESLQQLWANPNTGCSPHFWGRAMGWFCMALVDVLELLPLEVLGRDELLKIILRTANAVCKWQSDQGLWYQILDQGERKGNYLESSCSAMFCYFLLKGYRLGFLKDQSYLKAGRKAWKALVSMKMQIDSQGFYHVHDICSVAGLGGSPYRDGSYSYYVGEPIAIDDFKGVGPTILAALEISW